MANTDTRYEYGHDNRIDLIKRALEQHLNDQSNPHKVSLASLGEKEYVGSFLDILIEGDPDDITNRVVKLRLKTREGSIIEGSEVTLPMSGNATTWSAIIGDDPLVNEALNSLITEIRNDIDDLANTKIAGIALKDSSRELKDYNYLEETEEWNVFKALIDCTEFTPKEVYNNTEQGITINTSINAETTTPQVLVNKDDNQYIYISGVENAELLTDELPRPNTWYKVIVGEEPEYILETPSAFKADIEYIRDEDIFNAICPEVEVAVPTTLEEKFSEVDTDIEDIKDEVEDILTGYVQKTRKIAGISLQNDTENLQGYYYDTNQTLAAKLGTIENNKVTTDTDQTITSKKIFNGITKFGNTVEIADTEGKLTIEGNQLTPIPNTSGAKTGKLGNSDYYFDNAYINTIHAHEIQVDDIQGSLEGIVNTSIIRARKIYYKTNTGYGIIIPQNDNWESDRTLATTEDIKINKVSVNGKEQPINNKAINIKINSGNGINVLTNNENKETEISIDTNIVATQTDLSNGLATKQNNLSNDQLKAVNSGITSEKVTKYDGYENGKQDTINDLDNIRAGAALGATAVQPEAGKGLFSGSYNDLTDKPTIPEVPVKDVKLDNASVVDQNGIAQLTSPDLTPYATNTYVDTELAKKVNKVNGNYQYLDDCGPLYEDNKIKSYVGVHDGTGDIPDAAGNYIAGQLYAKDVAATKASGSWKGAKLNLYTDGFYYIKNRATGGETVADEIAVKGDLAPYALASSVPTKVSDLTNDSGYITNAGSINNGTITIGSDTINYSQVSAANVLVQADSQGKIPTAFIPDGILGNTILGGTVEIDQNGNAVATVSETIKSKFHLGTNEDTIILVNQAENDLTADPKEFGWVSNEGVYYIFTNDGEFADTHIMYYTGDWILSTGTTWSQVSNTDAVRTVNGGTGDVVINAGNLPGLTAAIEAYHDPSKVDTEINETGANGKALIFNEADGGGAKFEHKDGTWSGIAVNDGGASGIAAQIYALDGAKIQQGITEGVKLNITKDKINYIKNKSNNQTTAADEIAVKGDIPDVSNFVTETDLQTALTPYAQSADLATVATSGDYTDLSNTPTIPTNTSDLTNDGSDGTSTYVEASDLATVATTGDYDDLLNKPTIPTVPITEIQVNSSTVSPVSGVVDITVPITEIQVNSTAVAPSSGVVNITVPAAQVNSDWNANSGVAQILNKPTIPDAVVANPAGENPTASLTKLKVGNTVYEVAQGGSTYTAGTGIDITNDIISIDPTVVVKSIIVDSQTYVPDNTGAVDLGSISGGVVTLGYTIEE